MMMLKKKDDIAAGLWVISKRCSDGRKVMSEGEREIEGVISKSQAMTSFQHKYSAMQ